MLRTITYAGIGSRQITEKEQKIITITANNLADKGFIVMSGNAEGSDIAFQDGSNGNCVLLLPWKNFNRDKYSHDKCLDKYDVGKTPDGNLSVDKFHPYPNALSQGGRRMMCRNWHQIIGFDKYPTVDFVVCCANRDINGDIVGGTGQAVRIATKKSIPVFNIRDDDWIKNFVQFLKDKYSVPNKEL